MPYPADEYALLPEIRTERHQLRQQLNWRTTQLHLALIAVSLLLAIAVAGWYQP